VSRSDLLVYLQVLSVTMDEWEDADIDSMIEVGGNSYANSIYEAFLPQGYKKPRPDASIDERTYFIRYNISVVTFVKDLNWKIVIELLVSCKNFSLDHSEITPFK
jgi:Putative GTPase activating protein for Arf